MKAISVSEFGGPEVLKLEDVPDPRPPQSGEVLISVNAAGVNPYDTYMRSGAYGSGNPALPFTPGSDAAGVVESVATDVDLKPGDRVYTTGTITGAYAELALCKRSQVHPLPERVSCPGRRRLRSLCHCVSCVVSVGASEARRESARPRSQWWRRAGRGSIRALGGHEGHRHGRKRRRPATCEERGSA